MKTLLALLVLLCVCSGCEQPMAKHPIGTPWKEAELANLKASWLLPELGTSIHFVPQKNGHALAGMVVDQTDPDHPGPNVLKLIRLDCVFTRVGKHELLFYKGIETEEEKKKAELSQTQSPDAYYFLLIAKRDENHFTFAAPTAEFKELIRSGKLPGEIKREKKNTYPLIDADEKKLLEVIESVGIKKLFERQQAADRIVPKVIEPTNEFN